MFSRVARVALLLTLFACGGDEPEHLCDLGEYGPDCRAWTECVPGEYVATEGTATSDRVCAACAAGTYSATANAAACATWDTCVAGERAVSAGMASTDRVCEACTTGTYSSTENADACTDWTSCEPGEHVATAGTSARDRSCADCAIGTFTATPNSETCSDWRTCIAGEYVTAEGSSTTDRGCAACTTGFSTTANAVSCTPWSTCVAGEYAAVSATADHDRTCANCAMGTFSTMQNASACAAWQDCMPGTRVMSAGTSTSDRTCVACAPGRYSDTQNAALCSLWSTCIAGEYVAAEGTASNDRACTACPAGAFSTMTNAMACTSWRTCPANQTEDIPGTATTDRTCSVTAWLSQFGSPATENVYGLARNGRALAVVGDTPGALPNQTHNGQVDAFVRTYNANGTVGWLRQFGTADSDYGRDAAIDANGNVYVVGSAGGALPGQTHLGLSDAFLRAYSASGTVLWTRQFGTASSDGASVVTIDAMGRLVVAGYTTGTLPGQTSAGSVDTFVRWYSLDGTAIATVQFGTTAADYVADVAADSAGNVYVAGGVEIGGVFPGNTAYGGTDAYLRKLTASGATAWTKQFGTSANDTGQALAIASDDDPILAGGTGGVLGASSFGAFDAYARRFAPDGSVRWTRQFGAPGTDNIYAITMAPDGSILGTGITTPSDYYDVMYFRLGGDGVQVTTQQFGSTGQDTATAIATDAGGNFILAGNTQFALPGGTSAGGFDAFITRRPALP